jgi:uncharacterized membrane protein
MDGHKLKVSFKRHLAKTLSWRIIASGTTFILAYLFFRGSENVVEKATGIALVESAIKMLFYYLHERFWYSINFRKKVISYKRHLAKTVTWRIIASITTFILTYLFFKDDPGVAEKATTVMAIETVLKMGFYYFHERIWHKIQFGITEE